MSAGYDDAWEHLLSLNGRWVEVDGVFRWQVAEDDRKKYPHTCPFCGKPSYQGICPGSKVDCSAKCKESLR